MRGRWWVPGWVYRGGYTGGYPGGLYRYPPSTLLEEPISSEAGPGSPAGAGVGGIWAGVLGTAAGTAPGTTSARPGRSTPGGPPCPRTLRNAASQPITARFHDIYCKVSQNGVVSPILVEKACHSPYLQTAPKSRLLNFPDFHFRQPSLARN